MTSATIAADPGPASTPRLAYLPFVDGVRTIAVVSVLLFHADRAFMPGGFVGVDVFFVISGFLMTRICLADGFGFGRFYLSRARRIFPAYYLVLIVSGLVALAILLPRDLLSSSRSLAAGSVFLQNFVFWKQLGYFSPDLERNPFLHTWSLAVEWQFYLVLPFLIRPFRARRRLLIGALALLFAVTLAASAYGAFFSPTPTFYLMPFRIWEFLVGGFVALAPAAHPLLKRFGAALALLGVAMIGVSVLIFNEDLPFPGLTALLPCLGTGALLLGGLGNAQGLVARLLSLPAIRLTGQASYSIYLVHWPLFVFVRYVLVDREAPLLTVGLLCLSFALGFLSWRFIERPFRNSQTFGPARAWTLSAIAAALTLAIAGVGLIGHGLPQRFPARVLALAAAADDTGDFRHCLANEAPRSLAEAKCRFGVKGKPRSPSVVLWGDSFAAALADGVDQLARERGAAGAFLGTDSCPPVPGLDGGFRAAMQRCRRLQLAVPQLLTAAPVDVLIVHAAWKGHRGRDRAAFDAAVRREFPRFKSLARHVVIVGGPPGARLPVPDAMARAAAFGRSVDLRPVPADLAATRAANRIIAEQALANGYGFVDTMPYLCRNACQPLDGGQPLYVDKGHVRATTARQLAHHFADQLLPPVSPPES